MYTAEKINELRNKLINKKNYTDRVKNYLLVSEINIKDKFIIGLAELTSQMYGPALQKVIMKSLRLVTVKASLNRGDGKTETEKYGEIKVGLVNEGKIKLFQVRPYQELDWYISVHYNASTDELFCFLIPHEKIVEICSGINSSSHGAGDYRNEEKQIEIDIHRLGIFEDFKIDFEDIYNAIR